jgi:ribulose-phosphate 3-epimerase
MIAPSLLASDFSNVQATLKQLSSQGVTWLHLDVMDGVFVDTITFGPQFIKQLRPHTNMFLDTHLMITNPEKHIKAFADAGSDLITFHVEATTNPKACIDLIHQLGKQAGISIKPNTPVSAITPYLPDVDLVLIMSVEPGKGGQAFLPSALEKLAQLQGGDYQLQVDGGINQETASACIKAGATNLVVGTYLFQDLNRFKELAALER